MILQNDKFINYKLDYESAKALEDFNCGGYALDILAWYQPGKLGTIYKNKNKPSPYTSDGARPLQEWINAITEELPFVRHVHGRKNISKVINSEDECLIAFKVEKKEKHIGWWGDFHFMKYNKENNVWMDKRGASWEINTHENFNIKKHWYGQYKSPTIFFAVKAH